MVELPPGYKVVGMAGAKPIVQKKPRKRPSFKTPLAVRKAAAKARAKIKIPVVKGTIIAGPVIHAVASTTQHAVPANKLKRFSNEMLHSYTGMRYTMDGRYIGWDWKRPLATYGPLLALVVDAKYVGALKHANQILGQANVPIVRL